MNIVFGRANADALKDRYVVLELETLETPQGNLECFCVVPGNVIPVRDLPTMEHYTQLHQTFVDNLNKKNYDMCRELAGHLYGKFGGEVDSFYQVILDRIK